ncbi:hypothetical protein Tco_0543228 [Tanacetum coccineum]
MMYVVDGVLVRGVDMILEMDLVCFAIQETEIHSLMIQIRILSMILKIFPTTLHNPSTRRILHVQPEDIQDLLHKLLKDLQIIREELAEYINSPIWNRSAFYDDDDDDDIGDEHLSTIPETESDEVIKSSVENLVLIPGESEDFSDNESECDVPVCDDFTIFSNTLFDSDGDFSSSDDESFFVEDVPKENFKIYSNHLFDDEIISNDSLLEEFSSELAHINLVPPRINKANFDLEEEIRLIEELLYDNSYPRPTEESNSEISDATIESSSPSPIPVEDSDSLMEEIDLLINLDGSIPPDIESDDYDSEGDILFLDELLSNDSLSLPETTHPPAKPQDDGIFFDFEPDTGVLTAKVMEDISEHYVLMPKLLPTQPTLCPDIDTLLPFSSENADTDFNPGILSSNLLSHRGKFTSDFSKSPMMIFGWNIPLLDVLFLYFYPP